MTSEIEFIENIVKSTMRTNEYYVENGSIIGSDVGGIIYTADISNKIDPAFTYYHTNSKDNINRMMNVLLSFRTEGKVVYFNPQLRDDPYFETYITRKVDEGAFNYHITTDDLHDAFITIYPGSFHLSKNDDVGLTVKSLDKYNNLLMADFLIYKKKLSLPYHMNFLFMTF